MRIIIVFLENYVHYINSMIMYNFIIKSILLSFRLPLTFIYYLIIIISYNNKKSNLTKKLQIHRLFFYHYYNSKMFLYNKHTPQKRAFIEIGIIFKRYKSLIKSSLFYFILFYRKNIFYNTRLNKLLSV